MLVIDKLKTDESLYVRKSIADLLRAISKRNPDFVLELCKEWTKLKKQKCELDNK
ncbi:MAG: hypothetical protein QXG39_07590 [Candidatus Aenigmatarchaeota archaeon]